MRRLQSRETFRHSVTNEKICPSDRTTGDFWRFSKHGASTTLLANAVLFAVVTINGPIQFEKGGHKYKRTGFADVAITRTAPYNRNANEDTDTPSKGNNVMPSRYENE
jgi:hypothetical protein